MEPEPFDAEDCVWSYRFASASGDTARATALRQQWAHWQGEDSLHEMAFGKPIERKSFDERINKLIDREARVLERLPETMRETTRDASGGVTHRYVIRDAASEEARELRAISKELRWVFFKGSKLLAKDTAE